MEKLLAEQTGQRAGLMSIAVFLIIGMVILTTVNEKRGRQAATEYVQPGQESSHGG
jgi:MFS-type transporter involved in bile tolerance (Atg22 family)